MRTTSSLESFNSSLNRTVSKKKNYYTFFERLRLHESKKADTMHNLAHDVLPDKHFEPRHIKDQKRDQKIKFFIQLLCNQKISVFEFLTAMAADDDSMQSFYCNLIIFNILNELFFIAVDIVEYFGPQFESSDESNETECSETSEEE